MNDIYKPIKPIIENLNDLSLKSVFLLGESGAGKSTVLKHYEDQNKKHTINITLNNTDYISYQDINLVKLYYLALVIQKMLFNIQLFYYNKFIKNMIFFNSYVNYMIKRLKEIFTLGINDDYLINEKYLLNPQLLVNDFIDLVSRFLNYQEITLIIDNFDSFGESSNIYQSLMYSVLFEHFRVVATISDKSVIQNKQALENLEKRNTLIPVNYGKDLEMIKLLFAEIVNYRLISFINDQVLEEIITKTDGNLFTIKRIFNIFKLLYKEWQPRNYNKALLLILNKVININYLINIDNGNSRHLYIKG